MPPDNHFGAPWSLTLKVLSIVVPLVAGACAFLPMLMVPTAPWLQIVVPVVILFSLGISSLFAVRGYVIEPDSVVVRRLLWDTRVALRNLAGAEARSLTNDFHLRLCGNGGLFAFTGWYWCRSLGRFRLFGTDLKRSVVLRFTKGTVVITPDRPDEFVSRLLTGRVMSAP